MISTTLPERACTGLSAIAQVCVLAANAATIELAPIQDARVLGLPGYTDVNFQTDILSVYSHDQNIQRTLMQFDLGQVALEPGVRLGAATLTLTASTGFGVSNGKPMEIYRVTRPWTEAGLTWNRADVTTPWAWPGGDFVGRADSPDGAPFASTTANPLATEAVTWDVRELVDQWLEAAAPNHGLLLKSREGNGLTFTSREQGNVSQRPVLRIVTESGPPRLRVERETVTSQIVLSWRGVDTAVLQESVELTPTSRWVDSTLPVASGNGRSVVTIVGVSPLRLFRLRSK